MLSSPKYNFRLRDCFIGAQFLLVAFGALVLVPILTGLDPNVALFTAGLGTLVFQFITRKNIPPIFLASSFAFIAPINECVKQLGLEATLSGLVGAGFFYIALSVLVKLVGTGFIHKLFPAVVVGPVIMTIGLILSPTAVNMAIGKTGDGAVTLYAFNDAIILAFISLGVAVATILFARGMLKLVPIMLGVSAGYITAFFMGLIDFSKMEQSAIVSIPNFTFPEFNLTAILLILPIAIAPTIEHIGNLKAVGELTKEDYFKNPGLNRTLLGDGLATSVASFFGGPPNTTYGEVTGAVMITRVFNPAIMTWAAITAILLAFFGKIGAFLGTIPTPVMGGIMLLLFGIIASIGIGTLVQNRTDMNDQRNVVIVAVILVFAIGGMTFNIAGVTFGGIGLGAVAGVILNLILPKTRHIN
ncbi:MAG: uracil-xanthine permease family protein [Campylobacteraceae bacterium]